MYMAMELFICMAELILFVAFELGTFLLKIICKIAFVFFKYTFVVIKYLVIGIKEVTIFFIDYIKDCIRLYQEQKELDQITTIK